MIFSIIHLVNATNPINTKEPTMTCSRCKTAPAAYDINTIKSERDHYSLAKGAYVKVTYKFRSVTLGERYCLDCAEKRERELTRSDERSVQNQIAKKVGENNHNDDCTVVAVANATRSHYSKALSAMRKVGYKPNEGGVTHHSWMAILTEVAESKGMRTRTLWDPMSMVGASRRITPQWIADQNPGVTIAFSCERGRSGHAIVRKANGEWVNADASWRSSRVKYAMAVEKA